MLFQHIYPNDESPKPIANFHNHFIVSLASNTLTYLVPFLSVLYLEKCYNECIYPSQCVLRIVDTNVGFKYIFSSKYIQLIVDDTNVSVIYPSIDLQLIVDDTNAAIGYKVKYIFSTKHIQFIIVVDTNATTKHLQLIVDTNVAVGYKVTYIHSSKYIQLIVDDSNVAVG